MIDTDDRRTNELARVLRKHPRVSDSVRLEAADRLDDLAAQLVSARAKLEAISDQLQQVVAVLAASTESAPPADTAPGSPAWDRECADFGCADLEPQGNAGWDYEKDG